ncbi:alpha-galactosidase [Mucilaginibacter sabulilitoris]|uniref:Alpha-galactosidase n=1 Tax=Mucilaginibacter sabulilitoris TaxID=1173583 RepID=A0ABZ0TGE1_9SPHI|nr:alpha-galactosidase [Mucilaginibacter sabulilitoris]WPU92261.1 alpha-galactosidase [Mucilaginibacter sabulilitoris]
MNNFIRTSSRLFIALLLLPFAVSAHLPATPKQVIITYGEGSSILYDLANGTYTVYQGKYVAYSNVTATFKINNKTAASKDYTSRVYSEALVNDGFGRGTKHVITLTGKNLTTVKQVFYTYANREFFLTQIEATGKNLKSNSITPFSGNIPAVTGDARSIFVPFDNDTFIRYNAKPFVAPFINMSAEVGAVYDNTTRNGFVVGSVEHEVWKTGVRSTAKTDSGNTVTVWSGYTEESVTRDNITHGEISGDLIRSPKIFVGYFADWRTGLEEYARANRIAEPPFVFNWTKPTPVGWNSWGVMQEKLNYEKATKVADFFADSLSNFRAGNTAFIDLDSYWDFMLKGGLEGDYSKLKQFADYCKSKGLQPGVYWAPFTDWGWKGGPDRKVQGSNYTYGDLWTKVGNGFHDIDGARAIDPTHPGTKQHIDLVIGKLRECGFKMIKIDFLGHATAESTHFYDPKVTTGMQAYREGMEYLINKLGDQMLIYAAISPSLATCRYVHTRRIACDAFKTIKDTQYTLNSISYGWWQTFLYNYVDADHVVLSTESKGANRARMLSAAITGTFITGDDFSEHGQWSARAKAWYQNKELLKVIENGKAFEPVEGNTGENASEMFTRKIGNAVYLAVFNYSNEPKQLTIDAKRIGLSLQKKYIVRELLQGNQASMNIKIGAADAALYKLEVK